METLTLYSQAEQELQKVIRGLFKKALDDKKQLALITIEHPPAHVAGDFAVPCFLLAKELQVNPAQLAKELAEKIESHESIAEVRAAGPYVNFFVKRDAFIHAVLSEIYKSKEEYGSAKVGKGHKVMLEFFSPNTNKPLTIGHLRNVCLGMSLSRILNSLGYKVINTTLFNDRGIAVAKAMVAYEKFGEGKTPEEAKMKPDHFVGSFYVRFGKEVAKDPSLDKAATKMLQDWEANKKSAKSLWQQLVGWVIEGFEQTLAVLHVDAFEKKYYESEFYNQGKELVDHGLAQGIFKKHPDGYVYADLEQYGLPNKIVLRSDGTAMYITQDMYLASLKTQYDIDSSIIVVGSEQDLYFKQLFKVLELLPDINIDEHYHLSYGMVRLPDGKIKSRDGLAEGTAADSILDQLIQLATQEIASREPELPSDELEKRAQLIARGAVKYYLLSVNAASTLVFDPKKSIAFTGHTGPYLQYVSARITSLLEKSDQKITSRVDWSLLSEDVELTVVKTLAQFPSIVAQAAEQRDPVSISTYLFELAKQFSALYEQVQIIKAEPEVRKARLLLIKCVHIVLAKGLYLLGIEAPERM